MGVLAQLVRTKGRIQALLHANLIHPTVQRSSVRAGGRALAAKSLPLGNDERGMLRRYVDELERVSAQLANLDKVLAQQALDDPRAKRLMTNSRRELRRGLYCPGLDRRCTLVPNA